MRIYVSVVFAALLLSPGISHAEQSLITVEAAVANLIDNPAGSREIALKDTLALACNGKQKCSKAGDSLVPDSNFLIEVIYTCRDTNGTSRQKGPLQVKASATVDLNCNE